LIVNSARPGARLPGRFPGRRGRPRRAPGAVFGLFGGGIRPATRRFDHLVVPVWSHL